MLRAPKIISGALVEAHLGLPDTQAPITSPTPTNRRCHLPVNALLLFA